MSGRLCERKDVGTAWSWNPWLERLALEDPRSPEFLESSIPRAGWTWHDATWNDWRWKTPDRRSSSSRRFRELGGHGTTQRGTTCAGRLQIAGVPRVHRLRELDGRGTSAPEKAQQKHQMSLRQPVEEERVPATERCHAYVDS